MTGEELLSLIQSHVAPPVATDGVPVATEKKYVYGIPGIARFLGCSTSTINRMKKSGKLARAIKQDGRKIIGDCAMLLECFGQKKGGRR